MAFDLHPILSPGEEPALGLWYAVSPDDCGGEAPAARVGACANYEQLGGGAQEGRILLSAGATPEGPYSDLHQLTISKDSLKWEQLPGGKLPARYEHASFLVGGARPHTALYTFAGANQNGPLSDIWIFDQGHWSPVQTSGPVPSPRTFHTSTSMRVENNTLVVFGGGETGSNPVPDTNTHVFDPATSEWSSPQTTNTCPSPRQGHVSAVIEDKLYIHGGMTGQNILDDLHILDLDKWSWSSPSLKGTPSPHLAAHGCAVVGKTLYVFGGLSPTVGASDQLYCFDTELLSWEQVKVVGPPPPARLDHAMCAVFLPVRSRADTPEAVNHGPGRSEPMEKSPEALDPTPPNTVTVISPDSVEREDFEIVTRQAGHTPERSEMGEELSTTLRDRESLADKPSDSTDPLDGTSHSASVEKLSSTLSNTTLKCRVSVKDEGSDRASASTDNTIRLVPALFVFGGMDTSGHLHGDCFVIRPRE